LAGWFGSIGRLIGRQAPRPYVSAMDYTTSHRDMTFKEKEVMLRVCRDCIGFPSQQALGVLAHVEPLASTLYPSASDTRANLLRPLCFALL